MTRPRVRETVKKMNQSFGQKFGLNIVLDLKKNHNYQSLQGQCMSATNDSSRM